LQAITEGGSIVHRDKEIGYFDNDFADWEDEELEEDDLEDDDIYDLEELEDYD
jgi:GTP-binding protein